MLRALPGPPASEDFAERTLERFRARRRARRGRWLLAAAGVVLALALGILRLTETEPEPPAARLAELERQHRRLTADLAAFRHAATTARPVVYLGGDESLDLVVSLPAVAATGSRSTPARGQEEPRH